MIQWIEDLGRTEFVGTESRFQRIIQLLEEIVVSSTHDPATRLAQLEAQKEAIEEQIEAIRQTGEAPTMRHIQ